MDEDSLLDQTPLLLFDDESIKDKQMGFVKKNKVVPIEPVRQ